MATFIGAIQQILEPYRGIIWFFVIALILGVLGWFLYTRVLRPYLVTKEKGYDDIANRPKQGSSAKKVVVYFFHAPWCPHCRKAEPEFAKFSKEYNGRMINDCMVECIDVDTTDESENTTALVQRFEIDAIPQVIAEKGGIKMQLEGKVTYDAVASFVESITAKNE